MSIEEDIEILEGALAGRPTPGPYKVVTDEIPHKLGGTHKERRIFTQWDHPQVKAPVGVVNMSIGLGANEGDSAIKMVAISESDANWLAAADPDRIARLISALEGAMKEAVAHEERAERYAEMLARIGDFAHDKSTGPAVPDALWEVRTMAYEYASEYIDASLSKGAQEGVV